MRIRGAVAAFVLTAGLAAGAGPAHAGTTEAAAFTQFVGESTNRASSGSVWYEYRKRSDGWYDISVDDPRSADEWPHDGYGSILMVIYDTPTSSGGGYVLAQNQDVGDDAGPGFTKSKVKNAYFQICNRSDNLGTWYSCGRLHKK